MNDKNVMLKILFCIFGFIQFAECKYHISPDDIRVQMNPRPYVRHNTLDDLPSTVGDAGPLPSEDEAEPTPGPNEEDAQSLDKDGEAGEGGAGGETEPTQGPDGETGQTSGPNSLGEDAEKANVQASKDFCWFAINTSAHFQTMDELDEKYSGVKDAYKNVMGTSNFDEEMLKKMLETRSIAERALQNFGGQANMVPAGLDLGGFAMMRMPQSVLFFHRLKLRNNTRFTINYLHNDLRQMTLTARISMHDLHLAGHYERALTLEKDPSMLFYRPTSGDVEFLLKDVEYGMEGRYRLQHDRLNIEHVNSKIMPKEILMKFAAEPNQNPYKLDHLSFQDQMLRMRNDLDSWLRDYFNDFLMYFGLAGATSNAELQTYENEKTIALNRFADEVVARARRRLRHLNASSVKIPSFNLFGINGLEIRLSHGVVRGLDSMHRSSVATGKREGDVRCVDAVVRFSNLKVEYHYEAFLKTGLPPLFGMLVLTADELTAHMAIAVVQEKNALDLDFRLLKDPKSQSLTIEGSANRIVGNFKHLLEHHIIALMTNALTNVLQSLGSLTRCHPHLYGTDDPNYKRVDSNEEETEL